MRIELTIAGCMLLLVGGAWGAPATPATTRAAAAATRPAPAEALVQAIALMKQSDLTQARELLDGAWKDTPAETRSRALVLNRAIVDLADDRFVMRAVRDVNEFLTARKKREDEPATNILAAALNRAAVNERVKRGAIWQSAYEEWARRNDLLDKSRPGFHRWGTQWITDEEYSDLRQRMRDLEATIREQGKVVDADLRRLGAIGEARSVTEFLENSQYERIKLDPRSMGPYPDWRQAANDREKQQNLSHSRELERHQMDADANLRADKARLYELIGLRERPNWPTHFDPIEP